MLLLLRYRLSSGGRPGTSDCSPTPVKQKSGCGVQPPFSQKSLASSASLFFLSSNDGDTQRQDNKNGRLQKDVHKESAQVKSLSAGSRRRHRHRTLIRTNHHDTSAPFPKLSGIIKKVSPKVNKQFRPQIHRLNTPPDQGKASCDLWSAPIG